MEYLNDYPQHLAGLAILVEHGDPLLTVPRVGMLVFALCQATWNASPELVADRRPGPGPVTGHRFAEPHVRAMRSARQRFGADTCSQRLLNNGYLILPDSAVPAPRTSKVSRSVVGEEGAGMPEAGEWDGLFEGIEEVAARPGMARAWLSGLCWHPALDVQVRLAAVEPTLVGYSDRTHRPEVVDVAVAQSDWSIRRGWAEHQRGMSVAQWVRLIGDEPAGWRRDILLYRASWHAPRPSAEDFAGWAAAPDPKVRLRALYFRGLPEAVAAALAADPDPEVRALLCERGWEQLDARTRAALVADPAPEVREAAKVPAGHELPMSRAEFEALDEEDQWESASVQHFDEDCLRYLLDHPDEEVRRYLAENERLTPDTLAVLARDPEAIVRSRVSVRPDIPEELRAEIEPGLPARLPRWQMHWVEDQHGDPVAMRRLAASASVSVREAVAGARTLPPDVLELLSRDPASTVRYAVVHHNEAPPAELLLEAALKWTDPWPVLHRPDFPREALNGLADHPDPKRRRLALYAADCTPETVERLADDPNPMVHGPAAADPRLSPATALRLLAATEADFRATQESPGLPVPATYLLRRAVIGNPRLPVPVLTTLLRDRDSAQDAASNPAIPAAAAHRLIDLATAVRLKEAFRQATVSAACP